MRYLSTFSGIGGFELGIQLAYEKLCIKNKEQRLQGAGDTEGLNSQRNNLSEHGLTCIGYSEIDKYATQIYQKHFPTHHNYGDITKIVAEELPDFDLLVGGFPCQAFSIAGKRGGFEDTRGTMFFELARILRAKQPRLFVFENVKGLLSHDNGQTFRTIIATLDELGYDVQWQVLNSKNHGVPQNRERVFIIGHIRGSSRPEVFPFGGAETETCDIVQLNKPTHSNDRVYGVDGISPTLNTMQGGNRQPFVKVSEATKQGFSIATVGQSINLAVPNSLTRRGRVSDVAQTLDTGMQLHTLTADARIRRLTPTECERLQGFPDVEKRSIIEVCKQVNASGAEKILNIRDIDQDSAVQADVLIDCEESGVEILSHGKSLFYAKNVEKKNWSRLHIKTDDFVQMLVGINTTKEKIIRRGEEGLHQSGQCSTHQQNGVKLEKLSGKEITQLVEGAKKGSTTPKELLRCITSDHSDIKSLEQKLQTLSSYVTHVTTGFIPEKIQNQNTYTIEVRTRVGWTYSVSDTQRYKTLGNAVTVNVIRDLFTHIL